MSFFDFTLLIIYLVAYEDEKKSIVRPPLDFPDAVLLTVYLVLISVALFKVFTTLSS